jgi:hypothetical protein
LAEDLVVALPELLDNIIPGLQVHAERLTSQYGDSCRCHSKSGREPALIRGGDS